MDISLEAPVGERLLWITCTPSSLGGSIPSMSGELKVTFNPALYLQRRIWILDTLRREGITSVVDIGCGEGQLLSALNQPAPYLPAHTVPQSTPQPPSTSSQLAPNEETLYLHLTNIAGLDVSSKDLQFAIDCTTPTPQETPGCIIRWEPLEVKLWLGGLQSFNSEFVDRECIVASEVIEHLDEDVFSLFAPMLLGVYHPQILLLTTPSYTYNARFTAPNSLESREGYLDPTGRTDRVFRHDDHRFEWTIDEFHDWCTTVADEWSYTVTVSAVGRATEKDEWGRDEELGYASQVAEFRRINGKEKEASRFAKSKEILAKTRDFPEHKLLAHHLHEAHPCSKNAKPLEEIGEAVKSKMESYLEAYVRFDELWFEDEIAILCGGWIEILEDAITQHKGLKLVKKEEKRSTWEVELKDAVRNNSVQMPVMEREDSLDLIPPDFMVEDFEDADDRAEPASENEWPTPRPLDIEIEEGENDWSVRADSGDLSWYQSGDEGSSGGEEWGKATGWPWEEGHEVEEPAVQE